MTDIEAAQWFENRRAKSGMEGARKMFALAASAFRDRIDGKLISFADKPIIPSDQAGRLYIEDGDIRLIVQDGVYQGWYRPRGEEYHAKE